MSRLFAARRRRPEGASAMPDPEALFADLARARGGARWTDDDRRRDFRRVFLGSEAGRRVLYELFAWSHMFASTFVPGDAYATHWREGGRDIGLRLLTVLDGVPVSGLAPENDEEERS